MAKIPELWDSWFNSQILWQPLWFDLRVIKLFEFMMRKWRNQVDVPIKQDYELIQVLVLLPWWFNRRRNSLFQTFSRWKFTISKHIFLRSHFHVHEMFLKDEWFKTWWIFKIKEGERKKKIDIFITVKYLNTLVYKYKKVFCFKKINKNILQFFFRFVSFDISKHKHS